MSCMPSVDHIKKKSQCSKVFVYPFLTVGFSFQFMNCWLRNGVKWNIMDDDQISFFTM